MFTSDLNPVQPVAGYSFEEDTGTTVLDATGNGSNGTISGASRTAQGRFGRALDFDGVNDWVTIPTSAPLNLTTGMTLEAWVYPTVAPTSWRSLIFKEATGVDSYAIYANTEGTNRPNTAVLISGLERILEGGSRLSASTWTHVAATFDGAAQRLYIDGTEVARRAQSGAITTSSGPLRLGGNSVWGEFFQGRIDEVRVYNQALTGAEIQRDMGLAASAPLPPAGEEFVDPTTRQPFVLNAGGPVDLKIGPGGDLFYVDLNGGTIRRIEYPAGNRPPVSIAQGAPLQGLAPLTVAFDGSASSDPDSGDAVQAYDWDLDGDGQFDDSTAVFPSFTYASSGTYSVRLRVTDTHGASATSAAFTVTVGSGNTPPTAVIDAPLTTDKWRANGTVLFAGSGQDAEDGDLDPQSMTWTFILHHCPSNCHAHTLSTFSDVASGSLTAPDHEYPSHLELVLEVRDSGGMSDTASLLLFPETVTIALASVPPGASLLLNGVPVVPPFQASVIADSNNSLGAPSPQILGGATYAFESWSDGGAQNHNLTASASASYTASFEETAGASGPVAAYGFEEPSGSTASDSSGNGHDGAISGATRTVDGRHGSALSFDGINDLVTISDSNLLDITGAFTLESWVYLTPPVSGYETVILKEQAGSLLYSLYASAPGGRPAAELWTQGTFHVLNGTVPISANVWTHVATTWDGNVMRLFINGAQNATHSVSGIIPTSSLPLRLGGNSFGEYFRGRMDEVRVYSRALTQAEIQADMSLPVSGAPSNRPPVAVIQASPLAGPPPLTVTFDGRGSSDPDAGDSIAAYAWDLDGDGQFDDATGAVPTFTYSSLGAYSTRLRVADGNGAFAVSSDLVITVSSPSSGLVAAYGLNEGSGATTTDNSGNGHTGSISGASWTSSGKYGNALSFDGQNDWITVADSNLLDPTAGLTLEAWVNPSPGGGWRTLIMKEQPGDETWTLYSSTEAGVPGAGVRTTGGFHTLRALSPLTASVWTHVALTYSGSTLTIYVNGTVAATRTASGTIATSSGALRLGGNNIWGEYFAGRIDEVRIYNRALSSGEISTDMAAPIP
jgi:PKD repeat protein